MSLQKSIYENQITMCDSFIERMEWLKNDIRSGADGLTLMKRINGYIEAEKKFKKNLKEIWS